jgi:hypothetical protein
MATISINSARLHPKALFFVGEGLEDELVVVVAIHLENLSSVLSCSVIIALPKQLFPCAK